VEAKTGVPRRQQRLIAAGGHVGGDTVGEALKDGAVVHLFPLPNILTEDEYEEARQQEARAAEDPAAAGNAAGQAAHVPRILVADEQAAFELHRNMNDGEGVSPSEARSGPERSEVWARAKRGLGPSEGLGQEREERLRG
jgi:hypothetical protein